MLAGAGSRSLILGGARRQRDQTPVRSLVVLQVGAICLKIFFHGISILDDDLESGRVIENGCDCTSETTEGY